MKVFLNVPIAIMPVKHAILILLIVKFVQIPIEIVHRVIVPVKTVFTMMVYLNVRNAIINVLNV